MTISTQLLDKLNRQLDTSEQINSPFPLDGSFQHFKNGASNPSSSHIWVIGYSWEYKGNTYQWAKTGDWRSGANFTVKSYEHGSETKASLTHAKKYIEKVEETAKQEKEKKHADCRDKWKPIFDSLHAKSPTHGYLLTKKIKQNYRARVTDTGTLLIPVENREHGFTGCQQIFRKDNQFHKFFTKGIAIKGSFSRLTDFDLRKEHLIYLCEGYATGCSIYEATEKPVVIGFNCHNLIPVITSLRSINKSLRIIIAGDDDKQNPKNPGKYHASLAAKQFSNIITRFPKFESPDSLTDFNDLHVTESLEKVSEQLAYSNHDFVEIIPLGHKEGRYYYVNSQTSEIFNLNAASHTSDNLMAQAPRKHWGQKYGLKKNREGLPTETPDWDSVKEKLFSEQRSIGFFEDEKIRGIGSWKDKDKYVFNTGKYLIIDGGKEPISEHSLKTDFVYEAKKNTEIDISDLPTKTETDNLIDCFSLISFKNPGDYIYLIGMIILAQCPGFWSWRPHGWLTGCRGSGKSTILKWIDDLVFTNGNGIAENATAAGIRGKLGTSSLSVILDEAEASSLEAKRRMSQVMELARQSSSNTGSSALRGTATGGAISYSLNSLFIMGSIQPNLNNAADQSRFTVMEIVKGEFRVFSQMQILASSFSKLKNKLLAFTIRNASLICENQEIIRKELLNFNSCIDTRQADQLSWLISAYWTLKNQSKVDIYKLDELFLILNINNSDYIESNQADDESDCLKTILGVQTAERNSIYDCILQDKNNELRTYGIRILEKIDSNRFHVFFSSKNHALKQALNNSEYHDYAKILRRLDTVVTPNKTVRLAGSTAKGVVILLDLNEDFSDAVDLKPVKGNSLLNEIEIPF